MAVKHRALNSDSKRNWDYAHGHRKTDGKQHRLKTPNLHVWSSRPKCQFDLSGGMPKGSVPSFYRCRIAGFTLLELLVVITIIGILSGIILPAMGKVREANKKAVCISNLKQIGAAISMYLDDYRHLLPRIKEGTSYIGWADALNDNYLYEKNVFYCKTAGSNTHDWSDLAGGRGVSYGFNENVPGNENTWKNYDSISNKSDKVLVADAVISGNQDASSLDAGTAVSNRHSGGSNVLFCDFHVKWHPKATIEDSYLPM